jgi:alanine dehydrogenase
MIIGIPKEIKTNECRVGMLPSGISELLSRGHQIYVEKAAGMGIGITDQDYKKAGAIIVDSAESIFSAAKLIVKVKEPQPIECKLLSYGQTLFTYLHLAPDTVQTDLLLSSGCTAIAYETVTNDQGHLPLLAPMSEVAGRMSIQAGAASLENPKGGMGCLLGGVPGVSPAHVVVLGGGVVGTNAIQIAVGMGAQVTVLDRSITRLRELDQQFSGRIKTLYSTTATLESAVISADLVIGAVLIPGASAPKLINKALLKKMKRGSVLVDVAIDQGGCFETSKPTTHDDPTYVVDGVVHYCVANMPGAVARTSAFALSNVTLPYIIQLAEKGAKKALQEDHHLRNGLNIHAGMLTQEGVAKSQGKTYVSANEALKPEVNQKIVNF